MYLWFNAGAEETEGDRVMANKQFPSGSELCA